jgi:hypothetical protein
MQNSNQPYNLDLLWDRTNYGLDFWLEIFPEAHGKVNNNKHFKTHKENTASTTLSNRKNKDGIYRIYNHALREGMNIIDYCIKEMGMEDFVKAVSYLFQKYGLEATKSELLKPITTFEQSTATEGEYAIECKDVIENQRCFAHFLTNDHVKEDYPFFKELVSYEKHFISKTTNELTKLKVVATEQYPIFAYVYDGFVKIYEPKAIKSEKYNLKHHFLGKKPPRHVHGWKELFERVDYNEIKQLNKIIKECVGSVKKEYQDQLNDLKLDYVVIATGGSDALNMVSIGVENVIWFNSEAEQLNADEYKELCKIAKVIYNVPDNDTTGVLQAVKLGMFFIDIKTIWIPETIEVNYSKSKIKDIRDYVTKHKHLEAKEVGKKFDFLRFNALEFRFWKLVDERKKTYKIDNLVLHYFLKHQGFQIYKILTHNASSALEIEETRIIHKVENEVKTVSSRYVRDFVKEWAIENGLKREVVNMIIKTPYLNDQYLLGLKELPINTTNWSENEQFFMFSNKMVSITKEKIELVDRKMSEKLFWSTKVIKHNIKLEAPYFYATNVDGNYNIEILNTQSKSFVVMIHSSRMYWQKDVINDVDTGKFKITSPNLTEAENNEQMLHLLNKIYCLGYNLHRYKSYSKSYITVGTDRNFSDSTKDSNGGSGKSFMGNLLQLLMKDRKYKDGKELNKENPQFLWDGVTSFTDLIFLDDLDQKQDWKVLFNKATGEFVANHKGGKIYTIPNEISPKIFTTTNFVPNELSDSLMRRLLNYQCSNYYHAKGSMFEKEHSIRDDFGKDLLQGSYTEEEFNHDYNFLMQCLQFYLGCKEKINAPGDSLQVRNALQQLGDPLLNFLKEFFKDIETMPDRIERTTIYDNYRDEIGKFAQSKQQFYKNLELYCKTPHFDAAANKYYKIQLELSKQRNANGNSVAQYKFAKVWVEDYQPPVEKVLPPMKDEHFIDFEDDELKLDGYE